MSYNFDQIIDRKGKSIKYDKMKLFFGRDDLQPLWVADMDFATPPFIIDAFQRRLEHPIFGYTLRPASFNESFIRWAYKKQNWTVKESWLDFSPGVVSALAVSVLALTDENDKIIIQPPVYPPFFHLVTGNKRKLLENPLIKDENGQYQMDFDHLESIIDEKTKMIIIANPHNPVGRVWRRDELEKLSEIVLKHKLIVVSDDIHADFVYPPHQYTPIIALNDKIAQQSIVVTSPSKTFNINGMSTSVVIIPNRILKMKYNQKLSDMHLFLGNIFGAIAFETAYNEGAEWLEKLHQYLLENIGFVLQYLKKHIPSIQAVKPEGTFLMWLDFSATGLSHQQIKDKLINEAGLALNDGLSFGKNGEYYFRLNIATPRKNLETALKKLEIFK